MPGEVRAAALSDGRPFELFVERRGRESQVGNVYLGRVERVVSGMNAAFVDLGTGRSGFLAADAARESYGAAWQPGETRIADLLNEGETVAVQVVKDAIASKGPQLARRITLPGRFVVYTPTQSRISVSRQIEDEAEQARLIALMAAIADADEGFILRTAAAGVDAEDLERDAEFLRAEWASAEARRDQLPAPALIRAELGAIERLLRDEARPEMSAVRIDNQRGMEAAQAFCAKFLPGMADRLVLHDGPEGLFEAWDVEAEIERALAPRVDLPSGGGIVIESTEALTAIDVNSGSLVDASGPAETQRRTNLEAAAEVARQIRLRNIGGLIVVDFIHMEDDAEWPPVLAALAASFAGDRNHARIIGLTAAGLVEITRRRRRPSLAQLMTVSCPTCRGGRVASAETVVLAAMRALAREGRSALPGPLALAASDAVIDILEVEARVAFDELVAGLGRKVALRRESGYDRERFEIAPDSGQ